MGYVRIYLSIYLKTDEANWTMAPIRLKLQEAGMIILFTYDDNKL